MMKWVHDGDFFMGVSDRDHILIGYELEDGYVEWCITLYYDATQITPEGLCRRADTIVNALTHAAEEAG